MVPTYLQEPPDPRRREPPDKVRGPAGKKSAPRVRPAPILPQRSNELALRSERSAGVFRDGLKAGREAPGTRHGDGP